jgi:sialate O-acetylesterase
MFGSTLRPFDVAEAVGFAVCGEDKQWRWATGKVIAPDKVEVWSDEVAKPIAVRYAWSDNPVCNLFSNEGLPLTPFRTDDFEMVTKPKPVVAQPAAPAKAKPQDSAAKPKVKAKAAKEKPAAKKAA